VAVLKLHTYGLLRNSFYPTADIRVIRNLLATTRGSRGRRQHLHPAHAEDADADEPPTRECHQ